MAYTSEQYKYLLLKRMQRHFSMTSMTDRQYTYTFFGKLFDESVTVTEEAYNNFVKIMDDELTYCAENNIWCCENINTKDVETHSLVLVQAFAAIGIELVVATEPNEETSEYTATFTKPNGEVMVYGVSSGLDMRNYFYINAKAGTEYNYAVRSAPYYNMQDMEVLELSDCNINVCGIDCYWKYDADTQTMTISGDGTYYTATKREDIGSGPYTTLIIGANVAGLAAGSLTTDLTTIVLLHAEDFPLVVPDQIIADKTSVAWEVYTDNLNFRNYPWSTNAAINWHTLDEWEG